MKAALILIIGFVLSGCAEIAKSPVGQLTLADAQTASAMAKASNDAAGQKCYDYIASTIQSQESSGACGILCVNELKRSSITSSTNLGQSCGGVLPLVVAP